MSGLSPAAASSRMSPAAGAVPARLGGFSPSNSHAHAQARMQTHLNFATPYQAESESPRSPTRQVHVPCRTLPYLTLPHLTLHYRTIPHCLASTRQSTPDLSIAFIFTFTTLFAHFARLVLWYNLPHAICTCTCTLSKLFCRLCLGAPAFPDLYSLPALGSDISHKIPCTCHD